MQPRKGTNFTFLYLELYWNFPSGLRHDDFVLLHLELDIVNLLKNLLIELNAMSWSHKVIAVKSIYLELKLWMDLGYIHTIQALF